jgi:hypothetical protein
MLRKKYTVTQKNLTAVVIAPRLMSHENLQAVLFSPYELDNKAKVTGLRHFDECSVIYLNIEDVNGELITYFDVLVNTIDNILN